MFRRQAPFRDLHYSGTHFTTRIAKLRYFENILYVGAPAATQLQNTWRINSCFDINASLAGHIPYGVNELSAFWTTYRVIGVAYNFKFHIVEGTPSYYDNIMCAVQTHHDLNYPIDLSTFNIQQVEALHQQPLGDVKYKRLPHPSYAGGKTHKVLKGFVRLKKFIDPEVWPQNWSLWSQNPGQAIYTTAWVYRSDAAPFDPTFSCMVESNFRLIVQCRGQKLIPAT